MTMMRSQQFHNNSNQISHQIPAFGDWEYVNDLPITQYFESARQAGLIRHSHSSGECPAAPADAAVNTGFSDGCNCGGGGGYYYDGCNYGGCNGIGGGGDLYAVDCSKKAFGLATTTGSGPTATNAVKKKTTRQGREKKCPPTGKEGVGVGAGAGAGGRKQYYSGGKVCDVTDLRRHYSASTNNTADTTCRKKRLLQQQQQNNGGMVNVVGNDDDDDAGIQPRFAPPPPPAPVPVPRKQPKAVDEDLYKIPPHLLRSSHRKKKLGFISRCLIPCTV